MRHLTVVLALLCTLAPPAASARGDVAGAFDYYVLALSWTPTWCALEGDARGAADCAEGAGAGFTLHGLWPQHAIGWPSDCPTVARAPTRRETAAMTDIMGSAGLAFHQWRKHGTCSGLDGADYLALSRQAFERIARPPELAALGREVTLPARVVEAAFLDANPGLEADGVTITCRAGRVQEVRVCLARDLSPRACGADVVRDCALEDALLSPVR